MLNAFRRSTIPQKQLIIIVIIIIDHCLNDHRLALENQRFPVQVRLLAMSRGELSAVINVNCVSVCVVSGSGREELKRKPLPSSAAL